MLLATLCVLQLLTQSYAAKPSTSVSTETQLTNLKIGETVTLKCELNDINLKNRVINWFKDGVLLKKNRGTTYEIPSLNYTDQGYYYCLVNRNSKSKFKRKPVGKRISITGFLTTYVKFIIKRDGKKVLLSEVYKEIIKRLQTYLESQSKNEVKVTRDTLLRKSNESNKRKRENKMRRFARIKVIVYENDNRHPENLLARLYEGIRSRNFDGFKVITKSIRIRNLGYCLPSASGKRRLKGRFQLPIKVVGESVSLKCPYGPRGVSANFTCLEGVSGARWRLLNAGSCNYKSSITRQFRRLARQRISKRFARKIIKEVRKLVKSNRSEELNEADVGYLQKIIKEIVNVGEADSNSQDIVQIIGSVLNANESIIKESQKTNEGPKKLIELIQAVAENLSVPENGTARQLISPNLVIQVGIVDVSKPEGYHLSVEHSDSTKVLTERKISSSYRPIKEIETGLHLTQGMFKEASKIERKPIKVAAAIYENDKLFQTVKAIDEENDVDSDDEDEEFDLENEETGGEKEQYVTRVISSSVVGVALKNLSEPVQLIFQRNGKSPVCVFWDFTANDGRGNWSTEGCSLASKSPEKVTCHCNHMTNFAVLFTPGDPQAPTKHKGHAKALSIISYVGCGISLFGVLITLVTYTMFRSLRKTHAQHILLCFCVALALMLIVFMAGAFRVGGMPGCRAVAVLLHYFVLTVVLWMGVEGYQMYLAFVKVLATYQKNFMLKISVFAWGVPLIIVAVTAAVSISSYGNEHNCVVSGIAFIAALFAPALVILTSNFAIFFFVLWRLSASRNAGRVDKPDDIWHRCRTGLAILVLLGLTWVFGALAIKDAKLVFEYLFCIFNSLQGFFIFIFYCVRQPEVRKKWRSVFRTDAMEYFDNTKSTGTKNRSTNSHSPQLV